MTLKLFEGDVEGQRFIITNEAVVSDDRCSCPGGVELAREGRAVDGGDDQHGGPIAIIWSICWPGDVIVCELEADLHPAASRPDHGAVGDPALEVWVGIATPTLISRRSRPHLLVAPPAPPPAHPLSALPAAQGLRPRYLPKKYVSSWIHSVYCLDIAVDGHHVPHIRRGLTAYDMGVNVTTPCPIDNSPITIVNVHILKNCHIHKRKR